MKVVPQTMGLSLALSNKGYLGFMYLCTFNLVTKLVYEQSKRITYNQVLLGKPRVY